MILIYIGIVILGQIIGSVSGYWMSVAGQRLLHTLRIPVRPFPGALASATSTTSASAICSPA